MVKYSFHLKIKNAPEEYISTVDLPKHHEDRPESFFTPQNRQQIRQELQNKSSCKISDLNLDRIVKTWIQDIKEGYRDSEITIDLPLMAEAELENLQEPGNQTIPNLVAPSLSDLEPLIGAMPPLNFS